MHRPSILITAGPTREMLDPVRFLSNLSTGEMGYAIARAARLRKHRTTLISGPTNLRPVTGVRWIPVTGALEMKKACERHFPRHDVLIMTAAVCDFTPVRKYGEKIRRSRTRQVLFKRTADIVASLAGKKGKRRVIGFSLETNNWIQNAVKKLKRKRLDGIVANYYKAGHVPFGNRPITAAFINKEGRVLMLRRQSKSRIARRLLAWIGTL